VAAAKALVEKYQDRLEQSADKLMKILKCADDAGFKAAAAPLDVCTEATGRSRARRRRPSEHRTTVVRGDVVSTSMRLPIASAPRRATARDTRDCRSGA
jgi:hypothetical protein